MKTTKPKQSPAKSARTRKRREVKPVEPLPTPLVPVDIRSPVDRHNARMRAHNKRRPTVDAANKQRFISMIRAGELPADVCDDETMPHLSAFLRAMRGDEAFSDEYAEAVAILADMALQDAQAFARDCAGTGSIDQMRIADVYMKSIVASIEKLTPRTHGALVKHAGADTGPVQVAVINYARNAER